MQELGSIAYGMDIDIKSGETAFNTVNNQAKKTEAQLKKFDTQVTKTAQSVRRARPDMQNMSYQLQDMAVQAQMGTSAFVIMAQQIPQMLVGMGAWAGAIGVAVTVLGLMATTLIDTTTDIEKMEKAIEQVKAVITIGAGGVANYSDELKKLSVVSKELTQIKLNTALAQQQKALRLTGEAAKQAYEDATPFLNLNWDNYKNQQEAVIDNIIDDKEMEKLGRANPLIDNAINAVYGLDGAMKSIKAGRTDDAIGRITNSLDLLSRSSAANTDDGLKLINSLTNIVEQYKLGKLRAEDLKKAIDGTSSAFKGNASALKDYLDAIHISNTELQGNARAAEKLRLEKLGLEKQEVQTALAAWDYNQVLTQQKIDTEEAVKADKKRADSLKSVNDELDVLFDNEQKNDRKKSEKETESNITFAQGIINKGKSPDELMAEQYARLDQLRETDIENAQLYQDAMTSLEQQAMESRESMWAESYQRIGQQAADSMADYLTGVETAEDATRMLASTIVSEVIQSLVQMGISAVTQSLTTTAAATTGIATTTGAAVASTGVMAAAQGTAMATVGGAVSAIAGGLATAWAPAAAFASLATLGANSAPAIAGIYATMGATLGAQLVGGIVSNGITAATGFDGTSGAREYGGPVTNGKSYLVGERGPEIFTPHVAGGITSNKDMSSGGGGMTVNVSNNTPYEVYVTQDQAANIANVQIGKEAKKASQGRGNIFKGLSSSTNVRNKANRG